MASNMEDNTNHARRRRHIRSINMKVSRPVYTEHEFQQGYEQNDLDQSASMRVRQFVGQQRCTLSSVKSFMTGRFPIFKWLPAYEVRQNLLSDIISGLTVGTMRIPQAMAYALLAALPPVYGLYVAFFSVLCYTITGTSRHISLGTFAVVCIMTGQAIDRILSDPSNGTEAATEGSINDENNDLQRVYVASALALAVGIAQMLMGIFRLGFVTIYLSEPLVRGFTTGAAVHVFTSQFRHLFGIRVQRSTGPFSLVRGYIEFFSKLSQVNVAAVITSIITISFLVAINEIRDFLRHRGTHVVIDGVRQRVREPRRNIPVPSELIVIIVATVISYFGHFNDNLGLAVVGNIPTGIPAPRLPSLGYFSVLIGDAIAIAIVGFAVSISMAKIFAKKHKYEIDANQELLAYGSCQIFGSFFNCFPVSASLSRSLVQDVSGGKTQLAGLISSLIVLLVLLLIGPLFTDLPKCCLASIIVVALAGMFRQVKDLVLLWQVSTYDFLIWMVTCLSTILLGVDIGLAIGVVFSLMTVIIRTQQPYSSIIGRIPGTDIYRDINYYEAAEQVPGIKIFRSQSCLCFVNAEYFKNSLYSKVFKKKQRRGTSDTINGNGLNGTQPHNGNEGTPQSSSETSELSSLSGAITSSDSPLHTVIIDCSMFSFVDMVGLKTLHSIVDHCCKKEIHVVFAGCKVATREALLQYFDRLNDHTIGLDHMYLTVHDAVLHSQHLPITPTTSHTEVTFPATRQESASVEAQVSLMSARNGKVDHQVSSV
ncbi:prestin-like [Asterias amurensis]|uniref:prestin-like n=1 Tax=Asterias amurensis TaxID=7602 RepID=UPI003AB54DF9